MRISSTGQILCTVPRQLLTTSLTIFACIISPFLSAQTADSSIINYPVDESAIEDFLEQNEEEEFSDDTYNEVLEILAYKRLDINSASLDDLRKLDFLSDLQIQGILNYRKVYGDFKSPYELLGVLELSMNDIELLLPYVAFSGQPDKAKSLKEQFKSGKHTVFLRYQQTFEEKKGFTEPDTNSDGSLTARYLGIEPRFYARYRFQYGTDLSIGLTMEQDPGEPWKHPQQKIGIDYLSGHIYMTDRGIFKRIVAGDYEVNFGQGLVLQQSYASGKSIDVNRIKHKKLPFRPHSSANEADYSTGLAMEMGFGQNWGLVVFGSYRRIDGNVVVPDDDDEGEIPFQTFSSLQTSGLHRTESELQDKSAIGLGSGGGSLSFSGKTFRISVNSAFFLFSGTLEKQDQPYNNFEFSGDRLINTSVDYEFLKRNVSLFGELAFDDSGGWGMLNGGNFNLPGEVRLTVAHRYYDPDFHSLFGGAFAESSRPVNEHGLYTGITLSPFRCAEWSAYVDVYKHPYLRFGIDGPSHGIDMQTQFTYRPNYDMTFSVKGKYERKQENAPDNETAIDYLVPTVKGNLRLHYEYRPGDQVTLRSRIEFSCYNDGVNGLSKGFLAYQDIRYSFSKFPLTLNFRYALFQTDDYDSRIYAYENDLLYVFSVPAYYGRGSRYYLMAQYHINRYLDVWVRWSQTIYSDRDVIGSGLEEINNNTKSELKIQMRLKF